MLCDYKTPTLGGEHQKTSSNSLCPPGLVQEKHSSRSADETQTHVCFGDVTKSQTCRIVYKMKADSELRFVLDFFRFSRRGEICSEASGDGQSAPPFIKGGQFAVGWEEKSLKLVSRNHLRVSDGFKFVFV